MRFGFLELSEQVGVLDGQFLLGGIEVIESAVGFIKFSLDVVELLRELFGYLFDSSLKKGSISKNSGMVWTKTH